MMKFEIRRIFAARLRKEKTKSTSVFQFTHGNAAYRRISYPRL